MEPEGQEYDGHRIELRTRDDRPELLIDDVPVRYGQLPNGLYFLHDYAFDWSKNLMDLAQKFIDYRRKANEIRRERESNRGGK
jgi:hypothetical protein